MSVSSRLIALILGAAALAFLGYAYYGERQTSEMLADQLEREQNRAGNLQNTLTRNQDAMSTFFRQEQNRIRVKGIADVTEPSRRQALVSELVYDLQIYLVDNDVADWEVMQLTELVQVQDTEERAFIADDLIGLDDEIVEAPVVLVEPEALATVSTLVALLGSIGSAIGSAFLFLTGGGRRRIEQEMLAIDLEKQKVELARMKFEARDAIAAHGSS